MVQISLNLVPLKHLRLTVYKTIENSTVLVYFGDKKAVPSVRSRNEALIFVKNVEIIMFRAEISSKSDVISGDLTL